MRLAPLLLAFGVGCANVSLSNEATQPSHSRGPWSEVPAVEMPTGDTSIPISLLRDTADALLKLPGAKACDPLTHRPLVGLATEYCSTVYVAGDRHALSWRVTKPSRGTHNRCNPFFVVQDDDYPSAQVWIVGYVHNHVCGAPPSSLDLSAWPTDAIHSSVAMAEIRLIPGNPTPAAYENTPIEMASALVAERQDGTRIYLRYFPTGEVQQWSGKRENWVTLATCFPRRDGRMPQCDKPLRLLKE